MKKILFRNLLLTFLISFFLFISVVFGQENNTLSRQNQREVIEQLSPSEGWAYINAPIYGFDNNDSASKNLGESSIKYFAWKELRSRQYRERGTIYFERFPDAPHFKEWFLNTTNTYEMVPEYWKSAEAGAVNFINYETKGTPYAPVFDETAEEEWLSHYLLFRSRYLSDSSITDKNRAEFRIQELENNIGRLSNKISLSTGNLDIYFDSAMPMIIKYCEQAMDIAGGPNPDLGPLKGALGPFGAHNRMLESILISAWKQSKDSNARNDALKHEALLARLRVKPLQLVLPALIGGGRTIDLEKLRGKVVMLDFWNIRCSGCIEHMPKYERIYKQFHEKGFEMFSVCIIGSDPKDNGAVARTTALQFEKRQGVTYLSAELNPGFDTDRSLNWENPTWKFFDNAYGGSTFLLDQQGRLVATDQSGQWMEFEIRKLLGLPLDQTGK